MTNIPKKKTIRETILFAVDTQTHTWKLTSPRRQKASVMDILGNWRRNWDTRRWKDSLCSRISRKRNGENNHPTKSKLQSQCHSSQHSSVILHPPDLQKKKKIQKFMGRLKDPDQSEWYWRKQYCEWLAPHLMSHCPAEWWGRHSFCYIPWSNRMIRLNIWKLGAFRLSWV